MFLIKKSFSFNDDVFVISVYYTKNPAKVEKVNLYRFEGSKFNKLAEEDSIEECVNCLLNISNFHLFKKEFDSIKKCLANF